jgi:hypothetical protein
VPRKAPVSNLLILDKHYLHCSSLESLQFAPNVVVERLIYVIRILEVPGSFLGPGDWLS